MFICLRVWIILAVTSYKYVPIRVTNDGTIVGLIKGKYKKYLSVTLINVSALMMGQFMTKSMLIIKNKTSMRN